MTTTPETPDRAAHARAARTRTKHERWAQEMREAGWRLLEPETPEDSIGQIVEMLRKAGWTVLEPNQPVVTDGEGDRWTRGGDNLYRLTRDGKGWTLEEIRNTYGIWIEVPA